MPKFLGPRTLEEFAEAKNLEVELLEKDFQKQGKNKEYVFMFGLGRFSISPDDIHSFTCGFLIMRHIALSVSNSVGNTTPNIC